MVRQILVRGEAPSTRPTVNVFHFSDGTDYQDAADALETMYTHWRASVSEDYQFNVEAEARQLNTATGALEAVNYVTWDAPVQGNVTTQGPLPEANAFLVRWLTPMVVGSRLLRGRTYLPGITMGSVEDGQVIPASREWLAEGAADFVEDLSGGFVIWSRVHGVAVPVTAGSIWPEVALQRRRRTGA